ncbi:MAG TPA: hypothetical protein VIL36_02025 [Acidimicrobiales bacterium]
MGVMLSGTAFVVLVGVLTFELRCWCIRRSTGRLGHQIEEITGFVEDAHRKHRWQLHDLERRLELAARAVDRAEDMAYRSARGLRTMREDVGPRLLAAEDALGIHDVVVDLDSRRRRRGRPRDPLVDPEDECDTEPERPHTHDDADDDGNDTGGERDGAREPEPAGQAGSS